MSRLRTDDLIDGRVMDAESMRKACRGRDVLTEAIERERLLHSLACRVLSGEITRDEALESSPEIVTAIRLDQAIAEAQEFLEMAREIARLRPGLPPELIAEAVAKERRKRKAAPDLSDCSVQERRDAMHLVGETPDPGAVKGFVDRLLHPEY